MLTHSQIQGAPWPPRPSAIQKPLQQQASQLERSPAGAHWQPESFSPSGPAIEVLPDQLLLEVFALIPFSECIHTASLVCHRWLHVLRSPSPLWRSICYQVTNPDPYHLGLSPAQQAAHFYSWIQPRTRAILSLAMFSCLLLDMHTAHMVERVLHALGPGLREFKFDCYRGRTHASDGLSCALTGLRHCTRLSSLCLEGNHCLRALSRANKLGALSTLRGLEQVRLSFNSALPVMVCGWTSLRSLCLTVRDVEQWRCTGRDQAGVLRIPEEVSQLTLLEALSIDFADHRYREHPGLGNQLVAARGMAKLQRLRSLSLRCCALMGDAWADAWADAWPGLTSLADLTFGSCLGDSVSQQLPRICAAAPPQLRRLAVTDAHAVTLSAPLVHIGCLDLSRLTSLQELVWSNQRCAPSLAQVTGLTSLTASNSVAAAASPPPSPPAYDGGPPDWEVATDARPGGPTYHPIAARLLCAQWGCLARLKRLDFSHSDDLALYDMRWSALLSLEALLLHDIKRLSLSACSSLAELAALPELALVDLQNTVPADAATTAHLVNLAFALRGQPGCRARLLMQAV